MTPLKYAIAVAGCDLKVWQASCLQQLQLSGLAQLGLIIEFPRQEQSNLERLRLYAARGAPSQQTVTDTPLLQGVPKLSASSHGERLVGNSDDLSQKLRHYDIDFMLLFCDVKQASALANIPRYGIWYFCHSDARKFISPIPCFWEIYYGHDVTGAMLLKLETGNSGAGIVLRSGVFATVQTSYRDNVERAFKPITEWPVLVCRDIERGANEYFCDPPLTQSSEYPSPSASQVVRFNLVVRRNAFLRSIDNRYGTLYWNLGIVHKSIAELSEFKGNVNVDILRPHIEGSFAADPCVISHGGKTFCFCEEFVYAADRGRISMFELGEGSTAPLVPIIEEPFHLSYPQVFQHGEKLYCIPESYQKREIRLYEAVDFPVRWRYARTLVDNFSAIDSTVLNYDDKWWIFCTNFDKGNNSSLYIWHAPDLFGPWEEHLKNPVKIDVRSSRPAGKAFFHRGSIYRPAQDCSRRYGGRIIVNRIMCLTPSEFREETAGMISPPARGRFWRGLHTLSELGDRSVVDVQYYAFSPRSIINGLTEVLKSFLRGWGFSRSRLKQFGKNTAQAVLARFGKL